MIYNPDLSCKDNSMVEIMIIDKNESCKDDRKHYMANTYTQINIHAIFTVQGKENILKKEIRKRIFEYISGIIKGVGLFPLAVNGFTDHVHVFFELKPNVSISKYYRSYAVLKINCDNFLP